MIKIPEIQLVNIIKNLLKAVRVDYEQKLTDTVPEQSLLGRMYNGLIYEDRDIFQEAVSLFVERQQLTQSASSRKITVSSYYDRRLKSPPVIHIMNPSNEDWMNSLGSGLGEGQAYFNDDSHTAQDSRVRRFQQVHVIIFTSDNHLEVQLMYWTIKAGLISILDTLELELFQNVKLLGNELKKEDDKAPNSFFSRALTIQSFTEFEIVNFFESPNFSDILFPRSNDESGGDIGDEDLTIN